MKIKGIIINDEKEGKYFAFVDQFPGVCAQADTFDEVKVKVNKNFSAFLDRMGKGHVEFN